MTEFRIERPRLLADQVVDRLREEIVTGVLPLGEQLSENVLAEQLGVSRTPVREAFMRLEHERLVEIRPQRGTFVFECDLEEVRAMCELRAILETGALRLAAGVGRDRLTDLLGNTIEAAEETSRRSAAEYQSHDTEFHRTIINAAGNPELSECYDRIAGRVWALRCRLIRTVREVAQSQRDHREICDLTAKGDIAAAQQHLREHVHSSYRAFSRYIGEGQVSAQ